MSKQLSKQPSKQPSKQLDLATATMEQLTKEYKRTWGSTSAADVDYWSRVQKEIVRRQEAAYRAKFPDILGGMQCSGRIKLAQIDGKRFYLDGLTFSIPCSTCGGTIEKICGDYISYPRIGEPIWVRVWCKGCEAKFGHGDDKGGEYDGHRACVQIEITLSSPTEKPSTEETA